MTLKLSLPVYFYYNIFYVKIKPVYMFKIIAFFLFLSTHLFAYDASTDPLNQTHIKLGTGFRNSKWTVFLDNTIRINNDLILISSFETFLGKFYLDGFGFSPQDINFSIGAQYKNVGWRHDCFHTIDKKTRLPGSQTKNRFYIDV